MNIEKPPLGVAPHWYTYPKRMKELNEAIGNYIDFAYQHKATANQEQLFFAIAKWCEELQTLALLESRLESKLWEDKS